MVLKSVVRYIINRYLKNYIEELDYEKLKLDIGNGHVVLEHLRLKPEALADLNIPVTVATGYLEKLTLTIPWKNLRANPTKVRIDGLYMLIVPKNEVPRDMTEHHVHKMQRVQRKVDNLRKAVLDNKKLDPKETSFIERMRLQIMQNLVLSVRDLHISYETKSTTKLGHPFSFGITLHNLEMTTATDVQPPKRVKESTLVTYKLEEMTCLSIYWNTKCKSRIDMQFNDVVDDLRSKIATNNYKPKSNEMNYILHPVSPIIDLVLMMKPGEHNFERDSFDIDMQIEHISFNIDSKQFSDLLDFAKFQNYSSLYDRCREYRELLLQDSLDVDKLTSEQQHRVQILESKLDVFNLAYIRHSVEMETKTSGIAGPPGTATDNNSRWNSWWKRTNTYDVDHRRTTTVAAQANSDDTGSFLSDLPNTDVKIKLKRLELNLVSPPTEGERVIITHIDIADARIDLQRRSLSSSFLFVLDLSSFRIFGLKSHGQSRPVLVTAITTPALPLVHIELELCPVDKKSDYRLQLVIEPLNITYDAPTINRIVKGFDPGDNIISSAFPQIKKRTQAEMKHDLTCEKVFDMTIQLNGASFLLPQHGIYQNDGTMIHIHFGNLTLKSCLDNDENDNHPQGWQFYTKYNLKIHDFRLIYSQSDKTRLHFLRRIPLFNMNFYKCIYSDDVDLVDWGIAAKIGMMGEIQLSNTTLSKVIYLLQSVPLFYSNLTETLHRINHYFTIFPPHTSLKVDISIEECSLLLLINPSMSIRTSLKSHVLKTRDEVETANLAFNQLTMAHQTSSIIKNSHNSSWSFYQNEHIGLIYNGAVTTRL